MPVRSESVTVGTTATELASTRPGEEKDVLVHVPTGGQAVYIGGDDVTTTNGVPVAVGTTQRVVLRGDDVLYGVVAATTQATKVLRTRE